jgi:hypothetical protein
VTDQTVRPSPAAAAPAPRSIFAADAPVVDQGDQAAALFAELLVHARAETPLALAVVGPAGAGKSSFLNSALARAQAISAAARGATGSPFVPRALTAAADLSRLSDEARPAEVAAILSGALQRALRKAGGAWAKAAEDAGAAGADPHAEARAAAESYDEARKRGEAEARELEKLRGLRARLSDALLFDTPGSKVDSYARGARSRIDSDLRRFGFVEADSTLSYKQLVGEVAEAGGGAKAAPGLLRAVWGFASQRRLLVWAAVLFGLFIGLGAAWDAQTSWAPALREQNGGAAIANFLLTHRWLATFRDLAFWAALALVVLNLWRAWRFTRPLTRGAALLKTDVEERGAALDQQIAALSKRLDAMRAETEAARKMAEEAAARLARAQAQRAPLADLAATDPDERFLEALPQTLAAQNEPTRLVVGLDGLDRLPPRAAARALDAARRLLAAPGVTTLAAFDADRIAPALGDDPAERRAAFERLFQAAWRLEAGSPADQERALAGLLGGRPGEALAAPHGARSILDEPLTTIETDLLQRVAPLAGDRPRAVKRLLNLYRLARLASGNRPALALALAAEVGGGWSDPQSVNAAVADGRDDGQIDARLVSAVRAARAASPTGALSGADIAAARRLARRFVALDA